MANFYAEIMLIILTNQVAFVDELCCWLIKICNHWQMGCRGRVVLRLFKHSLPKPVFSRKKYITDDYCWENMGEICDMYKDGTCEFSDVTLQLHNYSSFTTLLVLFLRWFSLFYFAVLCIYLHTQFLLSLPYLYFFQIYSTWDGLKFSRCCISLPFIEKKKMTFSLKQQDWKLICLLQLRFWPAP